MTDRKGEGVLEQVARAISHAQTAGYLTEEQHWSTRIEWDKNDARKIARAALMAMREPGPGAVSAMFDRLDCGQLGEDYDTTDVWQAGIDAILAEGGE